MKDRIKRYLVNADISGDKYFIEWKYRNEETLFSWNEIEYFSSKEEWLREQVSVR